MASGNRRPRNGRPRSPGAPRRVARVAVILSLIMVAFVAGGGPPPSPSPVLSNNPQSGSGWGAPIGDGDKAIFATANPTYGKSPLTVSFVVYNLGGLPSSVTYIWVFGDGTSATGASVSHVYTSVGIYIAQVVATDGQDGGKRAGYGGEILVVDPDTDGDGVPDSLDAFPLSPVLSRIVQKIQIGNGVGQVSTHIPLYAHVTVLLFFNVTGEARLYYGSICESTSGGGTLTLLFSVSIPNDGFATPVGIAVPWPSISYPYLLHQVGCANGASVVPFAYYVGGTDFSTEMWAVLGHQ